MEVTDRESWLIAERLLSKAASGEVDGVTRRVLAKAALKYLRRNGDRSCRAGLTDPHRSRLGEGRSVVKRVWGLEGTRSARLECLMFPPPHGSAHEPTNGINDEGDDG
jgi:hypothetical protein